MTPLRAAFAHFREVTQALAELSEHQQVMALKFALFRAFERVHDAQYRGRSVEAELAELKAKTALRDEVHDAFAQHLHEELVHATRALAQDDYEKELHAVSVELLSKTGQCEALDQLCRSLVVTLERAADEHVADVELSESIEPSAHPHARASA
jgi:hypothetical protein